LARASGRASALAARQKIIWLPFSNAGKPVPSQARTTGGLIPKGAKNVAVAKEFLK
jgi:hypothetical protein